MVDSSEPGRGYSRPSETLAIVGSARGMGRWLHRRLFSAGPWRDIILIDADPEVHRAKNRPDEDAPGATVRTAVLRYGSESSLEDESGALLDIGAQPMDICFAVPQSELATASRAILPLLHPSSTVFDTCPGKLMARATLESVRTDLPAFGIHPLFTSAASSMFGQIIVACEYRSDVPVPTWLHDLVSNASGILETATASDHDRVMAYVQTATHQALIVFADVITRSGLSVEDDLWRLRTPLFEVLLGLSGRLISNDQSDDIASIQSSIAGAQVAHEAAAARARFEAALAAPDPVGAISSHMRAIMDEFGGTFFKASVQEAANSAVNAIRVTRSVLAERRDAEALVGIRHKGKIMVGHVRDLTASTVVFEDVVRGGPGHAILLTLDQNALRENARALGTAIGPPRKVNVSLSQVTLIGTDELERVLDEMLGRVFRDFRLLVPESVSGEAVSSLCRTIDVVDSVSLVTQEVRVGQREVIVRVGLRADRSVERVRSIVSQVVEETYAWPTGSVARMRGSLAPSIAFLGPIGTFSEVAARQAAAVLAAPDCRLQPLESFEAVVASIESGATRIGVLPILNSASGLVELTAAALLNSKGLVGGGIVDVGVRFDAYISSDSRPRTGPPAVYSHAQALRQCGHFIGRIGGVATEVESTAAACMAVARTGEGVALAAPGQGILHGLEVLEREVADLAGVVTRFLVVGQASTFETDGRNEPTDRWLWLLEGTEEPPQATAPAPRFEESVVGASGLRLIITTADHDPAARRSVCLGRVAWTPRTPIVRVSGPQAKY